MLETYPSIDQHFPIKIGPCDEGKRRRGKGLVHKATNGKLGLGLGCEKNEA